MNTSAIQLSPHGFFPRLQQSAALLIVALLLVLPTLCVLHCHGLLHPASDPVALFVCHDHSQAASVPLAPPIALLPMVLPVALLLTRQAPTHERRLAPARTLPPQATVAPLERPPRFICW
jgi:hypothetical protein